MLSIKNIGDVYKYHNEQKEIKANMIKKAIDASYNILTLDEFIRATEFKLPNIMELDGIRQFKADIPVLITKQLIESFGYSGEFRNQKVALMKLIKAHNLPYVKLTNEEYEKFACFKFEARKDEKVDDINSDLPQDLYPTLKNANGKSTHILMMPRDLNKLMMVVNTDKGDTMREFCQTLIDLFDIYQTYQNSYKSQQLMIKDTKIDALMKKVDNMTLTFESQNAILTELKENNQELLNGNQRLLDGNQELKEDNLMLISDGKKILKKLDISTEDRVPKSATAGKQEHFILLKLNRAEYAWTYYVLRVQHRSVNARLRKKRLDFPNLTVLVNIEYQPNSKNLFERVQESLTGLDKIKCKGNFVKLVEEYTEEEFVQAIVAIDNEKKVLPVVETDEEGEEDED